MKYYQEPWYIDLEFYNNIIDAGYIKINKANRTRTGEKTVALVHTPHDKDEFSEVAKEGMANAILISFAPEMFHLLKLSQRHINAGTEHLHPQQRINRVIDEIEQKMSDTLKMIDENKKNS